MIQLARDPMDAPHLLNAASGAALPNHVAVIMDGNGRWAKAHGLPRTAGHKRGADALKTTMTACRDFGIRYLTIYAFSSENWKRPPEEVGELMLLLKHYLSRELKNLHENHVCIRFIGERERLADDVRALIGQAEQLTRHNTAFFLTVGLSYGARQEIVRAARALAERAVRGDIAVEAIDEAMMETQLYTASLPEVDLLIRTGGERRLSNFLLWQAAYTELYFTPTLWPDFSAEHLRDAVDDFAKRERRYGNAV